MVKGGCDARILLNDNYNCGVSCYTIDKGLEHIEMISKRKHFVE